MSVFEVEVAGTITARDKDFQTETPPPGGSADDFDSGPNRFTIWIPSEHVTVNMGQAVFGTAAGAPTTENSPTSPPLVDAGFVVRTDRHAHLHTMGSADDQNDKRPSLVRLGVPPQAVKAHSNAPDSPTSIGTLFEQPHDVWDGYAMLTRGGAVHESRHNHLVVSDEGDLRLVGKRSVSVGTNGDVLIAVQDGVELDEFCKNTGSNQDDPSAAGPGKMHRDVSNAIGMATALAAAAYGSFMNQRDALFGYNRAPMIGKTGWKATSAGDWLGFGIGETVNVIQPLWATVIGPMLDTPGKRLDLFTTGSLSAVGEMTLGLQGLLMASLSSPLVTTVSGGAVASFSSSFKTAISGTLTSITGTATMAVEAQTAGLTLRSHKDAQLTSRIGKMFVTSQDDAQVNSIEGQLFLHGKKGFSLLCGGGEANRSDPPPPHPQHSSSLPGPDDEVAAPPRPQKPYSQFAPVEYGIGSGFGIVATVGDSASLIIGTMDQANQFASPTPNFQKAMIVMTEQAVVIRQATDATSLHLRDSEITLRGQRVSLL
jgi:hypothetical protein